MNEITLLKDKVRCWGERIKAQALSGQSIRVFCEEQKLNRHTFSYWKSKLKQGRFIPISGTSQMTAKARSPRIHLPGFAGRARYSGSAAPRTESFPRASGTSGSRSAACGTANGSNSSVGIRLPNGVQIELGSGLEAVEVHQLIRRLCGVGDEKF